jgi:hypothetical protein
MLPCWAISTSKMAMPAPGESSEEIVSTIITRKGGERGHEFAIFLVTSALSSFG